MAKITSRNSSCLLSQIYCERSGLNKYSLFLKPGCSNYWYTAITDLKRRLIAQIDRDWEWIRKNSWKWMLLYHMKIEPRSAMHAGRQRVFRKENKESVFTIFFHSQLAPFPGVETIVECFTLHANCCSILQMCSTLTLYKQSTWLMTSPRLVLNFLFYSIADQDFNYNRPWTFAIKNCDEIDKNN